MLPSEVVLYSSGWESTGCALRSPRSAALVLFNYGQRYYDNEASRAERFATAMDRELVAIDLPTLRLISDEREGCGVSIVVPDRNLLMLRYVASQGARVAWFGTKNIHPLVDPYGDSNLVTLRREATDLGVEVRCPYTLWPKALVKRDVRKRLASRFIFCSENLIP